MPTALDVKAFVPAKDVALSLDFYRELGFAVLWQNAQIAELEIAGSRLLLQNFYVREWAENFMIRIEVESAAEWYAHVQKLIQSGRYPGVSAKPPALQPWGEMVSYCVDPSGVLIHMAERRG